MSILDSFGWSAEEKVSRLLEYIRSIGQSEDLNAYLDNRDWEVDAEEDDGEDDWEDVWGGRMSYQKEEQKQEAAQDWYLREHCGGRAVLLKLRLGLIACAQLDLDLGPGTCRTTEPISRTRRRIRVRSSAAWARAEQPMYRVIYRGWWGSQAALHRMKQEVLRSRNVWYDPEAPYFSGDPECRQDDSMVEYSGRALAGLLFGWKLVQYF